nr:hypothetical protein [Tanacetum cinerariifolium]
MHDGLGRAITTASSLGAEQGNGNITKTQTKATPSGPSSPRTSSMGGPGCHFTMGDSPVQAWPERLSNLPNESPLGEDKVTHLENELISTKSIYNKALITLTKRVKKLEKKLKHKRRRAVIDSLEEEAANLDHEDSPKQGRRIEEINKDENVNLVKSTKDKGKAIMQESESSKKIKKKEMMQISLVEEITQRFYEEEQAQILRDEEMLEKERESLSIKERSRLLAEFIDKRKKMLAAKKADEKQNKPPTQAQQRTYMSNYLKNIGGYTLKQLKQYSFKEIKMLFDNTMENIRRFVPMESEGQEAAHFKGGEGSSKEAKQAEKESTKKAGGRLKRKTSKAREDKDKRQKKQDNPEKLTLMNYVEVISDSKESPPPLQITPTTSKMTEQIQSPPPPKITTGRVTRWRKRITYRILTLKWHAMKKLIKDMLLLEVTPKEGKLLAKEDLNLKFLRSLPSEWNTHVVVWRNKSDLDTMSLDDLYNNFKMEKQEVRGTTSTNTSSQNMAFVSSPSPNSTNEVPADFGVSTANLSDATVTNEVPADFGVSTANLSDATVYAFLANQPNRSQLMHEDLEQIHEDDLKEMDLKWQLALLSMRAKRFFQKTEKKITINGSDTAGYDKSKIECNGQLMELVLIRATWLMMKLPQTWLSWLRVVLKSKLEKISNEKDALETKVTKFENASQSLDKLIGSQVTDNSKKGLGYASYNAFPPPHTRRFSPPRINLSHTGLPEFVEPSVQSYGVKPIEVVTQKSSVKISAPVKEHNGAPFIEDWESNEEDDVESPLEKERETARCKYHQRERMVNRNNHSRVNHNANIVSKAMLTRTGLKLVNSVRPVNPKRNFQRRATYNNRNFFKKVNTAKEKVNTARPNSVVLNAVRANKGKAGHSYKHIEDQGYFNSGCSWHMARNISYLTDFKEFDGGYVAYRGGAKDGKITGKGTIRTADESYVLLKVPRKNNMYNVDMKNIVPKKDLTCLVAKATYDESMLWHKRLVSKPRGTWVLVRNFVERFKRKGLVDFLGIKNIFVRVF